MKKIILFLLILLITGACFAKEGMAVINCKNGWGWLFVYSSDGAIYQMVVAFKGRSVSLDPGIYTFAFDYGNIAGYNDGFPRPEAEYHIVKIEENKTTTVNVEMNFK